MESVANNCRVELCYGILSCSQRPIRYVVISVILKYENIILLIFFCVIKTALTNCLGSEVRAVLGHFYFIVSKTIRYVCCILFLSVHMKNVCFFSLLQNK